MEIEDAEEQGQGETSAVSGGKLLAENVESTEKKKVEVVEEKLESEERREDVEDNIIEDEEEASDVGEEVNLKPIGPISMPIKTATPSIKLVENDVHFASLQSDRNMLESSRIDHEKMKQERESQIYQQLEQLKHIRVVQDFSNTYLKVIGCLKDKTKSVDQFYDILTADFFIDPFEHIQVVTGLNEQPPDDLVKPD